MRREQRTIRQNRFVRSPHSCILRENDRRSRAGSLESVPELLEDAGVFRGLGVELECVAEHLPKLAVTECAPQFDHIAGEFDCGSFRCNSFEIEWPPRSGRRASFPEIDQAQWFALDEARRRINPAQVELLERLERALA